MPAAAALAAERVGHRYGRGAWLLDDVTLSVPPGGLLRVRGGNGAGKSTLLRLLAGTVAPRRGTVHRAGPVGYLPQQTGDLPAVDADRLATRMAAGDAVVLAEHEPLPLPGGELLDLGGAAVPAVEVVLGGTGTFSGQTATGGRLTLIAPAGEQDALLLAALQEGWSVLSVGRRR